MLAFLFAVLISVASASIPTDVRSINFQSVTFAVTAISVGFLWLFFGFKLFKPTLAIAGFSAGAIFGYVLIVNLEANGLIGNTKDWIYLATCAITGVIGSFLLVTAVSVGIAVIGGLGGFALSVFILAWRPVHFLEGPVARPLFMTGFAVGFALLALVYKRVLVIFATSLFGGLLLSLGVDSFADVGLGRAVKAFLSNGTPPRVQPSMYGLLAAFAVATIVGCVVQHKITAKDKSRFLNKKF